MPPSSEGGTPAKKPILPRLAGTTVPLAGNTLLFRQRGGRITASAGFGENRTTAKSPAQAPWKTRKWFTDNRAMFIAVWKCPDKKISGQVSFHPIRGSFFENMLVNSTTWGWPKFG
jgi:hypothetical protein